MTDLNLAASPAPTVLAAFLASVAPQPALGMYRGVLTPTALDVPSREIAALAAGAAVHDLGWLRRVSVRGSDRFRWLSGMVTNMVKDLPSTGGAWNLVLNAQGRIQGDLTVWREGEGLELEVTADQAEKLIPYLDGFIVMDDVEFGPVEGETSVGLTGPKAAEFLERIGLSTLPDAMTQVRSEWKGVPVLVRRGYGALADHYAIWISEAQAGDLWNALATAGAQPAGSTALEAFRVAEGIPLYGVDIVERDLPQETSQLRALHFDKGCYIGQEIVERIRSRGNVHRHLRSLQLAGPLPEPGTRLTLDGAEAGHITSAAELPLPGSSRLLAIGMVRAEAEAYNLPLQYSVGEGIGSATVLTNPPDLASSVER